MYMFKISIFIASAHYGIDFRWEKVKGQGVRKWVGP